MTSSASPNDSLCTAPTRRTSELPIENSYRGMLSPFLSFTDYTHGTHEWFRLFCARHFGVRERPIICAALWFYEWSER